MEKLSRIIVEYPLSQLVFFIGTIIIAITLILPWSVLQDMSHTGYWQDVRIYYGYESFNLYIVIFSIIVGLLLFKYNHYSLFFILFLVFIMAYSYFYFASQLFALGIPEQHIIYREGYYIAQIGALIQIISLFIGLCYSLKKIPDRNPVI